MSNALADAVDWYLNKLNTLHVLPVNGATLARDISAKQLSDGNFTPRPLTADNFTDEELYALKRLSTLGGFRHITADEYNDLSRNEDYYGEEKGNGLADYLTPLRSVSTTLGHAGIRNKGLSGHIVDTYDFNRKVLKYYLTQDGMLMDPRYNQRSKEEVIGRLKKSIKDRNSAYGRFRMNAMRLGHVDSDPDGQKIKADISLDDIDKRISKRKFDDSILMKPASKKDFVLRMLSGGALTGAALGAGMGSMSGALVLLADKKKRKKWFRTMLLHSLGGAAISSILGAAGGGYAAHRIWDRFNYEKKAMDYGERKRRNRQRKIRLAILTALAYATPVAALATSSGYGAYKAKDIYNRMLEEKGDYLPDIFNIQMVDRWEDLEGN